MDLDNDIYGEESVNDHSHNMALSGEESLNMNDDTPLWQDSQDEWDAVSDHDHEEGNDNMSINASIDEPGSLGGFADHSQEQDAPDEFSDAFEEWEDNAIWESEVGIASEGNEDSIWSIDNGQGVQQVQSSEESIWGIEEENEQVVEDDAVLGEEVQGFINHLDDDIFEGAGQSLRQYLITRVTEKIVNNSTDEHFENILKREYAEYTYQQNKENVRIPTSLYLVRKILGVKDLWQLEYHPCACEGHFWRPLHPKFWRAPGDEGASGPLFVCPECGSSRFSATTLPTGRVKVVPKRVSASRFFYLLERHKGLTFGMKCTYAALLLLWCARGFSRAQFPKSRVH